MAWHDNKLVCLLSSFAGSQPIGEARRFFKSKNEFQMITCPNIVKIYNKYMGGVDLLDSMLGYYRIMIRSKKWYMRIFHHLLDMAIVNAWLLWRRKTGLYMPLVNFKTEVSDALCKQGKISVRRRGRPSNELENEIQRKKRNRPTVSIPQVCIRRDNVGHIPSWETRMRCKYPKCTGRSFVHCVKCKIPLCLNKDRNCFMLFHTT